MKTDNDKYFNRCKNINIADVIFEDIADFGLSSERSISFIISPLMPSSSNIRNSYIRHLREKLVDSVHNDNIIHSSTRPRNCKRVLLFPDSSPPKLECT